MLVFSLNMKKVSVFIVNLNTSGVLRLCLDNLKDSYGNLEVIVADNSSTDGSPEMIKTEYPWVKLLELQNYGLSHALNKCIERATGDYHLYLGSDAFPDKQTIKGLVDYFENTAASDIGAASVRLFLRNGKQDMDGHRGFPTPWVSLFHFMKLDKLFPRSEIFGKYFMSYKNLNTEHEIDMCITHFFFVPASVTSKVGKWDEENFFLYGEDVDYCYRIKQAGFKIMYLPQFTARHWKGVTVGIRKETKDVAMSARQIKFSGKDMSLGAFRVEIQKMSTDAMEMFYRKHLSSKYIPLFNIVVIFGIRVLKILRILKQKYINALEKVS